MSKERPVFFLGYGDKEHPPASSPPQLPVQASSLPPLKLQVSPRPELPVQDNPPSKPLPQASLPSEPPLQASLHVQIPSQASPRQDKLRPKLLPQASPHTKPPLPARPHVQNPPQDSSRPLTQSQANPRPQPHPFIVFFALAAAWAGVEGLDCFKCGSVNGSDPNCGDPFHHNHSAAYLASPCLAGWKGRQGAFPATHCVKLSGYFYESGESMYVRGCTTDSGTLTVDTELGRQSHCGVFLYDDRLVVGCVEACNEFDGCNASSHISASPYLLLFLLLLLLLLLFVHLLAVRGGGADL